MKLFSFFKRKEITKKQFLKALKKRTEADLIISRYNLQESKKLIEGKTYGIHLSNNTVITNDENLFKQSVELFGSIK